MLQGYRTVIWGLFLTLGVPALSYLSGVDWTVYVSPNAAAIITGVITIVLRLVTTTPVGKTN